MIMRIYFPSLREIIYSAASVGNDTYASTTGVSLEYYTESNVLLKPDNQAFFNLLIITNYHAVRAC